LKKRKDAGGVLVEKTGRIWLWRFVRGVMVLLWRMTEREINRAAVVRARWAR